MPKDTVYYPKRTALDTLGLAVVPLPDFKWTWRISYGDIFNL